MSRHDDHRALRARHRIIMRYWTERGLRPVRGEYRVTPEMARIALEKAPPKMLEATVGHDEHWKAKAIRESGVTFYAPGELKTTAAVLCPGPSLKETWPAAGKQHAVTVAVNNAIEYYPADWWCARDSKPLKTMDARPKVGILTSDSNVTHLRNGGLKLKHNDGLDDWYVLGCNLLWTETLQRAGGWSVVAALALAARLGASRIELFGDDKTGQTYFDGTTNKGAKKTRWDRETRDCNSLREQLRAHGVDVVNIQPTDPPDGGEANNGN